MYCSLSTPMRWLFHSVKAQFQWVHLPHGLEGAYWSSRAAYQEITLTDRLALFTVLVIRFTIQLLARYFIGTHQTPALYFNLAVLASQVLQLAWLLVWTASYYRYRSWINTTQRLRSIVVPVLLFLLPRTSQETAAGTWYATTLMSRAGTWRALFMVVGSYPLLQCLASFNHQLSLKPLLMVNVVVLAQYVRVYLPEQLRMLDTLWLRDRLHSACMATHVIVSPAIAGVDATPAPCYTGAEAVLLIFVHIQLALVLPVWCAYRRGKTGKARFLQQHALHICCL